MASIWNLLTLALATSTVVLGTYVTYSNVGPRGALGDQGESFAIDVTQNLSDCSDFETVSDQYPITPGFKLLIWVVETDSRPDTVGCPTVYDLHDADVTSSDLSGHLLIYNGTSWRDHGLYVGIQGTPGTDGNVILYASAAPTTEGINGDFYLRTSTSTFYGPKASGVWPSGTALTGTAGTSGTDGTTLRNGAGAPSNGTGTNGDFYIDTSATALYGPKAAGSWPSAQPLINTGNVWPIMSTLVNGTNINTNTLTTLPFNSPQITQPTWSYASSTWTCAVAGTYEIDARVEFRTSSSTVQPEIRLRLDASTDLQTNVFEVTNGVNSRGTGFIHYIGAFSVGQTINLMVLRNSASVVIITTNSNFVIKRFQ
jgi:hypothetical protein